MSRLWGRVRHRRVRPNERWGGGKEGSVNKNALAALGVLVLAVLIGLLWVYLAANYSGH
jgi:hypothetical protein